MPATRIYPHTLSLSYSLTHSHSHTYTHTHTFTHTHASIEDGSISWRLLGAVAWAKAVSKARCIWSAEEASMKPPCMVASYLISLKEAVSLCRRVVARDPEEAVDTSCPKPCATARLPRLSSR
eukprot:Protomagalhaensia_wolfi_Nauph_80__3233@NODE_3295_length_835_cov_14_839196_g2586_i0_p1_GENE_NODE_3295_length_835_cov_14_839196_g2586_i0NODE_3295_length_835_cov_14_839196_g2586_i0_p1_ORF_typecomplete_len123_score8_38TPR_14/PF13428_6/7_1e03TPR_14/PF13428_6/0_33_NODE_3295_length_835_cov_14_839196_g2586_i0221589